MYAKTAIINDLNARLRNILTQKPPEILEAGCGSLSRIKFPVESRITGIDISKEQLEKNEALHQKILGDVQTYQFDGEKFDLIVCWDLLEHLEDPEMALNNLKRALNRSGAIVIAVPNQNSLKGIFTKYSPHWVHVLYYRYIVGKPDAGKVGNAPFETIMHRSVTPGRIRRYFISAGFCERQFCLYDRFPRSLREEKKALLSMYYMASWLLGVMSFGRLGGSDNTDLLCLFQKRSRPT